MTRSSSCWLPPPTAIRLQLRPALTIRSDPTVTGAHNTGGLLSSLEDCCHLPVRPKDGVQHTVHHFTPCAANPRWCTSVAASFCCQPQHLPPCTPRQYCRCAAAMRHLKRVSCFRRRASFPSPLPPFPLIQCNRIPICTPYPLSLPPIRITISIPASISQPLVILLNHFNPIKYFLPLPFGRSYQNSTISTRRCNR